MNPVWLLRNVMESWRHAASVSDFLKRLLWIYAQKLPSSMVPNHFEIGFRFPAPIGSVRFSVRPNNGSDVFVFGEVFNHQYYQLGLPRNPQTVLDLGANAGFTAIYFSRAYVGAQLACVEPMPENVRMLKRNLELNSISAEVFPVAVAVGDGCVTMEVFPMDYGHRVVTDSGLSSANLLEVPALSVPTILNLLGWNRIGLLKMDIEGYERELLSKDCSWLRYVDAMCVECHEGFGVDDLRRISKDFGFLAPVALPGIWLLRRE